MTRRIEARRMRTVLAGLALALLGLAATAAYHVSGQIPEKVVL